ncbi:MAG: 1-deoxy-D-xylulose-5-phosphate reductoisomerase [Planctomycetes bacterium]|nr:1-deoxy-D-xylulose-5-phosphate reductoisomerase [Planctomycetota bacterium]
MKKRVIILGSTGSIGRNTLAVLEGMRDEWEVVGLAAGSRWRELAVQANAWKPQAIALTEADALSKLGSELDYAPKTFHGSDALVELVSNVSCDCVVVAVAGAKALPAALRAIELGRRIALATKEVLVIAGGLLVPLAERTGATIIPIDSEHSAIFQALQAGRRSEVRMVYLTASGGPFRTWSDEAIDNVRVEDALRHPTWEMGPKITIDSATMMNKALEIVETRWLFDLQPDKIRVIVHPESIIHSIVEFCDGSMMAQLGAPDMRTPIQYALTYPERRPCPSERLNLEKVCRLNLYPPDMERFPALGLGYDAARRGGTAGAVLNAANETAVALFSDGAIPFRQIARHVELALSQHPFKESPSLDDLLEADQWARREVARCTTC